MSDRNQRELSIFTTQFIGSWVAIYPTVLVKYENRNFVEPNGGQWVAFSVVSGKTLDAAIGGIVGRSSGVIYLQIFMSENTGTATPRAWADQFSQVFGNQNYGYSDSVSSGNIWTYRPALKKSPLRMGWIQWTVAVDFKHDQYSAPPNVST